MLDDALRFIAEHPNERNVAALEERLNISWGESIQRCVDLSRFVYARTEDDFAYVCGCQFYGPLQANVWAFFGGNLERHTRMVLRDFRRYFRALDTYTYEMATITARVPVEFPETIKFAMRFGLALKESDGATVLLQRG